MLPLLWVITLSPTWQVCIKNQASGRYYSNMLLKKTELLYWIRKKNRCEKKKVLRLRQLAFSVWNRLVYRTNGLTEILYIEEITFTHLWYQKGSERVKYLYILKTTHFVTLTWHISLYTDISKLLGLVTLLFGLEINSAQRCKSSRTSARWQKDYSETSGGLHSKHQFQEDSIQWRLHQQYTKTYLRNKELWYSFYSWPQ